jgi:hypothetical protein
MVACYTGCGKLTSFFIWVYSYKKRKLACLWSYSSYFKYGSATLLETEKECMLALAVKQLNGWQWLSL